MNQGRSQNRFQILGQTPYSQMDTTVTAEQSENTVGRDKIPPIIIAKEHPFSSVIALLGKEYSFQRMSIGTKVVCKDRPQFLTLKEKLTEAKLQYHTYRVKDSGIFKLLLTGLHKVDTNDILGDLREYNIQPKSIAEIQTKMSSSENALYVLEFNRSLYSKSQIFKVNYILNVSALEKPQKNAKRANTVQALWNVWTWRRKLSQNPSLPTMCRKDAYYRKMPSEYQTKCSRV